MSTVSIFSDASQRGGRNFFGAVIVEEADGGRVREFSGILNYDGDDTTAAELNAILASLRAAYMEKLAAAGDHVWIYTDSAGAVAHLEGSPNRASRYTAIKSAIAKAKSVFGQVIICKVQRGGARAQGLPKRLNHRADRLACAAAERFAAEAA